MATTKQEREQEIERLSTELKLAQEVARNNRLIFEMANENLQRRLTEVSEDRRRLTQAVESLARRCAAAEGNEGLKCATSLARAESVR